MWFRTEVRHSVPQVTRRTLGPLAARRRGGFTLIELIVVIAIIATLAALVVPAMFRNVGDAKANAAKSQVEMLALALNGYRLDNDQFPATEQGLAALRSMPTVGEVPRNWRGPYLTRVVPLDPWGRAYVYQFPGRGENATTFELYSLGRDGKPGGSDEDADVTSWGGPLDSGAVPSPAPAPPQAGDAIR